MNMIRIVKLVCGAALLGCMAFSVRAEGIVYLSTTATGADDGTSWANAYTNIATAIADANSHTSTLYIAKGVYTLTNTLSVTSIPAIYGGFKGDDPDETVAARQYDVNRTVLSGDLSGDDCWCHVVPNIGSDFGYVLTELTENPIVSNGALNMPPAFTGDYDLYLPVIKTTNRSQALSIKNWVNGVVDGLYFTGFSGDAVVKFQNGTVRTDLTHCRFVGNQPRYGAIRNEDKAVTKYLDDCRILYNRGWEGNGCVTVSGIEFSTGGLQMSNSEFLSCGFLAARTDTSTHYLMNIQSGLNWNVGLHKVIRGCTFARCYSRMRNSCDSYNLINSYMTTALRFINCAFSNNLSVAARAGYKITTFPDASSECLGCSFVKNRLEQNLGGLSEIYLFGSYGYHKIRHNYDACSFVGNSIFAKGSTKTSGTLAATIIGSCGDGNDEVDNQRSQLTNCSFDNNTVEMEVPDGVTGYKCRGVYNRCRTANAKGNTGLANCTFIGPKVAGVCDVLQLDEKHSYKFNIVNCHFQYTGGEPYDDGFVFLAPNLVYLYSCTLANYVKPDVTYSIDNHAFDPLPFVTNAVGTAGVTMLVPNAKTPLLRESADVVYNGTEFTANIYGVRAGFMTNYAFRAFGASSWQILTTNAKALDSSVSKNPSALQFADAKGDVRTLGTSTRGAVQGLTPLAETGATLTLRREPFDAGSFAGPQVQCVAAGSAITPVTAVANTAKGCEFEAWYTTNDVLYSSSPTLSIDALNESLVLVAKFSAPKTKVIFELGPHGTFTETGNHTYTNELSQGSEFPSVPAYTLDEGWAFGWWPTFPVLVPGSDVAYTGKVVTTSLRVLRVAADSKAENPDGLTWDTAFSSLADAYKDAAIAKGELWLKEGRHDISSAITLKSNVALRGGFAGTETRADEADPKLHPTLLNGDVARNDIWAPQSVRGNPNPSYSWMFKSIWDSDVSVKLANPDFVSDNYWAPGDAYHKGYTDDTLYGFVSGDEALENIAFYGLTFVGFGKSAIREVKGGDTPLVVSNCQFLVNNTTSVEGESAIRTAGRAVNVMDCFFNGNVACINASGKGTSTVVRCQFDANYTVDNITICAGVSLSGSQDVRISDCSFTRGYAYETYFCSANSVMTLSPGAGYVAQVDDCSFVSNRIAELSVGCILLGGSGSAVFNRCQFTDNLTTSAGGTSWTGMSSGLIFRNSGLTLTVRDSYFARCRHIPIGGGQAYSGGTILAATGGTSTFFNDTFEDCSINGTMGVAAGLFAIRGGGPKIGVANCLFMGSCATGAKGGFFAADADTAATSFNVLNTAVVNSSNDFTVAYLSDNAARLGFANSVIDRFDANLLPKGSNGFIYNMTSNTAVEVRKLEQGPNGVWARKTDTDKVGRRVWLKDNVAYFYDEVANPDKPWRKVADKSFFAASVTGLPSATNELPNAFGGVRHSGHNFFGPVAVPRGFLLLVR